MQATSREAYGAAVDRLEEYAEGVAVSAVIDTADEIFAVARLFSRELRLRRALSDPARSDHDRARLLRGLLAGKVSEPTLELLTTLFAARWPSATALLTATERFLVETLLVAADRAGELAEVEDELFRFGQVVDGSPALATAIGDMSVLPARRMELVHSLLVGKAHPVTVRLAELAVHGFGGRGFLGGLARLVELAAGRREREVAYVTVAVAMTEDAERRLGAVLSHIYGREVSMKLTVDPEILGGMSVRVGSDLYDGTVARRLMETRNALTAR